MNTFLLIALIVSLLALVLVAWRHLALRRKLEAYTHLVQQAARGDLPTLPTRWCWVMNNAWSRFRLNVTVSKRR